MKRQPCLLTGCLARRLRGFEFLRHEELEPGARRDGRTPQFVMAHNFKRSYFRLLLFVRVLIFPPGGCLDEPGSTSGKWVTPNGL